MLHFFEKYPTQAALLTLLILWSSLFSGEDSSNKKKRVKQRKGENSHRMHHIENIKMDEKS